MTKRKLVQFGIIGALVLVLAAGGFWTYRKGHLFGSAEELGVQAQNLTATIPSIADDIPINYWAYKYIDAVFKKKTDIEEDENATIMNLYPDIKFHPSWSVHRDGAAVHFARALNIPKCDNSCPVSFEDVPRDDWAYSYIEALYQGGYVDGYADGLFHPDYIATVGMFRKAFARAGKPINNPPGQNWDDNTEATRAKTAAFIAYNLNLPGDEPEPAAYLQFDFPESSEFGFDFGYEVWRRDPSQWDWTLIYVQDPPEQGLTEASDFGMFFDKDVTWNKYYDYSVYLFNRDGDRSAPAVVDLNTPQ